MIQHIRENLVVLINPVSNPTAATKRSSGTTASKGKTDRNSLPRQSPLYWSTYAMVDINRDAHQLVHDDARGSRMFFDWHPTVVLIFISRC
jgi:hypothetical protein